MNVLFLKSSDAFFFLKIQKNLINFISDLFYYLFIVLLHLKRLVAWNVHRGPPLLYTKINRKKLFCLHYLVNSQIRLCLSLLAAASSSSSRMYLTIECLCVLLGLYFNSFSNLNHLEVSQVHECRLRVGLRGPPCYAPLVILNGSDLEFPKITMTFDAL
ncbi:hypothetical protein BpHYR1_003459 [Brachionus plicatilis]|uniref:Uncharacterized protein n=1 Tax=Brachionus plicatilis TaxID=10195 RepID=A0A3M7TDN2_BRAPC|nr:hypothetical protein BpHYR1_003459 [Brachionus plicatilis]